MFVRRFESVNVMVIVPDLTAMESMASSTSVKTRTGFYMSALLTDKYGVYSEGITVAVISAVGSKPGVTV